MTWNKIVQNLAWQIVSIIISLFIYYFIVISLPHSYHIIRCHHLPSHHLLSSFIYVHECFLVIIPWFPEKQFPDWLVFWKPSRCLIYLTTQAFSTLIITLHYIPYIITLHYITLPFIINVMQCNVRAVWLPRGINEVYAFQLKNNFKHFYKWNTMTMTRCAEKGYGVC